MKFKIGAGLLDPAPGITNYIEQETTIEIRELFN